LQHGALASARKKEIMSNCICQFAKTMVLFVLQHGMCVIATWFLCSLQHCMSVCKNKMVVFVLQHGMCVLCNLVPLWFATWHVSLQKTNGCICLQHGMCVIATWFLCSLQHVCYKKKVCLIASVSLQKTNGCICLQPQAIW
jgi:hypothetical protein